MQPTQRMRQLIHELMKECAEHRALFSGAFMMRDKTFFVVGNGNDPIELLELVTKETTEVVASGPDPDKLHKGEG